MPSRPSTADSHFDDDEVQDMIDEVRVEYETKMQMEQAKWRGKEQELRNEVSRVPLNSTT